MNSIVESETSMQKDDYVPVWHKANLTIKEAAAYSGIGENSLRELAKQDNACFCFCIGKKLMFNRRLLDEYIESICRGVT